MLGEPKHEGKDEENLTHFFRHCPTKGKTYRWKGNTEVREGSLAALLKKTYNNVTKIR